MYSLTSIRGNSQSLDGGAMFGHVPKAVWSKWISPDEKNRIPLACRALLIQEENKNILLEAGIGAFFDPSLRSRYGVNENDHVLLNSLDNMGLSEDNIDFIILSHLHFDHAGGLLSTWQQNQEPKLLFPNAKYIVSKPAWDRACHPHYRDRASFIPVLNILLQESGRLIILETEKSPLLGDNYRFLLTNGHTPGLLHTIFRTPTDDGSILFASDLIPGSWWLHLPITMGYDRAPELLIDEKKKMIELVIEQNGYLFYTHDANIAMSRVVQGEDGKFVTQDEFNEFFQLKLF